MFSARRWNWFIFALCVSGAVGCAHSKPCGSCSSTAPPPVAGCTACGSHTIMTVVADPSGRPNAYLLLQRSNGSMVSNADAQAAPSRVIRPAVPQNNVPAKLPTTKLSVPQTTEPAPVAARPQADRPSTSMKPVEIAVTTSARYDHAKDYGWVMGKLEYLYSKKVWRVRFAPAEVEDDLGGSVTLLGVDYMSNNLKDGQMVRVDGILVDPESRLISPQYQVHAIKRMD